MCLVGDFFQLHPVLLKPLFSNNPQKLRDIQAKAFYTPFGLAVELETVMRQQSDDAGVRFQEMLGRLREERLTRVDFERLASRVYISTNARIISTWGQVQQYNLARYPQF